jgi:hypothetical protein
MNVLFTCVVGHGHFFPMVPLAKAFQDAGHPVAFATDPGFSDYIELAGFEAHPAGLDHAVALSRFLDSTPGFQGLSTRERWPIMMAGMFGRIRVPPMLDDLLPIVETTKPRLLIHDSTEMAGAIAAEVAGIAHAEHAIGILRPRIARLAATEATAPFSAARGVRNPGVGGLGGELYLDICPPGIQQPEIGDLGNVQRLRPGGPTGSLDEAVSTWIAQRDQPTVYVTLGTVFNTTLPLFQTILDGLEGLTVNVIVTVGEGNDPAALGVQPANVLVERFIPQAALLPHCRLLISHAGSGAMLGALAAGVPMLAVPQGADQFYNAERIANAGLGLRLLPQELTAENVRDRASRLLADERYARAASAQRFEIEAMPGPEVVVARLLEEAAGPAAA